MPTYRQSRISETCVSVVKWLHKLNKQMEKKMDELNSVLELGNDVSRIDSDTRTNINFDEWVDDVFDLYEDSIVNARFNHMDRPIYGSWKDTDFS